MNYDEMLRYLLKLDYVENKLPKHQAKRMILKILQLLGYS